ncbi:hypothetical protein HAX54_018988 [Datura stramonium]|uniref:TCP domain-containing protein n=1 Tax=Datura stramonium TaxID=4076 RepID=A0ABS8UP21_DATST|nr:hypothetical protein [Datura stramonium]
MAEPFRSTIRFQSGARYRTRTQKRKRSSKLKCNQSKAGKRKAQQQGSESGSSEESAATPLSSSQRKPKPTPRFNFETSSASSQETFVFAFFIFFGAKRRTCNIARKNGRHSPPTPTNHVKAGRGSTVGEIVEVQGGHIVRSTGRKDRHSKVCTAKGPRDRRVRLSAHTAIQFYDVQDRLGYDRPSVPGLAHQKAKPAIDELAELPAWKPTIGSAATNANLEQEQTQKQQEDNFAFQQGNPSLFDNVAGPSSKRAMGTLRNESNTANSIGITASFLPPSLESDAIADTIKSFFPMGSSTAANSSAMQFQSFQEPHLLSRTNSQNQVLSLFTISRSYFAPPPKPASSTP